ncbi:amidase [Pseudoclavibacter sp. CFCC 13611]|uniref:amidase n=1 Tax=Pseudoclavibacter sp. CFCC 13611 TaxID=2615178 RepID=UPI001301771A|nr:amidase [Pseudoclavibacter sp. CFCC 13611]KAB1662992.1 amidase [Pseudoclavibacter sp. CFCC 13611]
MSASTTHDPAAEPGGTSLTGLSAAELVAAYKEGDLEPQAVVSASFELIEKSEPALHAIYDSFPEEALEAAQESARRWASGHALGPLDGVPVTLKENQKVKGRPTPWGSAATTPVPAESNAPVIERLQSEGAIILGRTTMPELGMLSSGVSSLHETVRNPWNLAWSPGGSSSGGGAAAAIGYAPINLGSDIGGSVRLPASWCGVAGFKPTFGRIAVDPPYFGRHIGPMGRSVADLALATGALAGPDDRDPYSLPKQRIDWADLTFDPAGRRIGLVLDVGDGAAADPEVLDVVRQAAEVFERAGATIVEIPPFLESGTIDLIDLFWRIGHWNDYCRMDPERRKLLLPFIAEWCRGGHGISGEDALRSHDAQLDVARRTIAATADVDVILSPVSPGAAFPAEWPMPSNDVNDPMSHIGFCVTYNMSGQPAVSVNGGFTEAGSPVGVQIAAARYEDRLALAAAHFFESERPASAVRPWPTLSA